MEVIRFEKPQSINVSGLFIAMGTFDGVHLGHQKVINTTIREAQKQDVKSGIFTFEPHPLQILSKAPAPGLITTYEEKEELIRKLGVDFYFVQAFNPAFAAIDYRSFIVEYLVEKLGIKGIVVGKKFCFGRGGQGTWKELFEAGRHFNFKAAVLEPLKIGGQNISSTLIRRLIMEGHCDKIPAYLGRCFSIYGQVTKGDGRGRKLGFPTANIQFAQDYVKPKAGVYAVRVTSNSTSRPGVVNFGRRPTFQGLDNRLEVHIIDCKENLYGQPLQVSFLKYLREEIPFSSAKELQKQIVLDIKAAKGIYRTSPFFTPISICDKIKQG